MTKGEKAEALFKEGYNCAQAVAGAFCEELNMDLKTAVKLASSFGGGMGRMREVCGAVSGMFMVAGAVYGYDNPDATVEKKEHYELIQNLAKRFKDECGSIICRELIEGEGSDPTPSPRTQEYYKKRPCGEYVRIAAEIMEEVLKNK